MLVVTIRKHPLHAQFDEVLAEILKVKDNKTQGFRVELQVSGTRQGQDRDKTGD